MLRVECFKERAGCRLSQCLIRANAPEVAALCWSQLHRPGAEIIISTIPPIHLLQELITSISAARLLPPFPGSCGPAWVLSGIAFGHALKCELSHLGPLHRQGTNMNPRQGQKNEDVVLPDNKHIEYKNMIIGYIYIYII